MSGRLPRLRALRPRPQPYKTEPHKEGNLKESRQEAAMREHELHSDTEDVSYSVKDDGVLKNNLKHEHEELDCSASSSNYECKMCKPPKPLLSVKAYLDHLKKDHKQKGKFTRDIGNRCSMCAHVALNSRDLETHQRVHHLKRRFFKCTKCSYVTHVRARYTKHVKYHSMPMIKCDACDFRTPYKWNLDRHTRNHGGGGAFQCRACNFTADIRQSLTVHETNHHEPPVSQANRKSATPFERKLRNSPKRYNQVGASDFRESLHIPGSTTVSISSGDSFVSDQSIEDKRNAIANAECIALKCEEKGCQFITAWDSEMQRHLAECHAPITSNKSRKPLPMLIPLSPAKLNNMNSGGPSTTLLKVPRVRVRPELAQIARDTELAKLYGNKEASNLKKDANNAADLFEKKNASFFDKLKEKLTTTASINNGVPEVAVSTTNDLKCWCTFKASSMEELACHKQIHHTALSVSVGTTRCPKCRRRCKSSTDLQVHMQCYHSTSNDTSIHNSLEKLSNCSELRVTSYRGEYAFPAQMDWDVNLSGQNSSGSSVEGSSTHPSGRRVFKCPHCPFWASTASRFHVHIVGHLNRKPFECSLCAYRSNWRWDITKHIKLKAAKDPVHMTARVLMTDETGRRNYSKYNKYLSQVEHQSWDDQNIEEHNVEEMNSDEPATKLFIMSSNECLQTSDLSSSPISIVPSNEGNHNFNTVNIGLKPPPLLKAVARNRGQSLLKNNLISPHAQLSGSSTTTIIEENKRTMWKCKRCNFRHSNKEIVSTHVKCHSEPPVQRHEENKSAFNCEDCPFSASDAATLSMHRVHHRPNLEAIFKCYLCPYYVSTKAELLDHVRLHGEELAVVHQQAVDYSLSPKRHRALSNDSSTSCSKQEKSVEQVIHITTQSKVTCLSNVSKNSRAPPPPPLLLDTRALPEAPLVWVSRPDGTLAKMLKCRHCPFVSSRRAAVRDHETMHLDSPIIGPVIACTDCSFTCTQREVMVAHTDMHSGSLGTIHCLVDDSRPDSQQLSDLTALLGFSHSPVLGSEPDLRDLRLVHCCSKCPARFLCEKELRIHIRYHSTELAYSCQWCSYAARQPAHLLAHQKAHSTEYQERTKHLLSLYGHSQRYPPPTTACVEPNNQDSSNSSTPTIAWIVVEVTESSSSGFSSSSACNTSQRTGNQVFTCAKCPARYFKLDALEYHMTLHGSNNRYRCTECDYSSKTSQNLVKHQVVHRRQNETTSDLISNLSSPPDPQFGLFMRGNPNFVYPGYLRNGRLKEKRYKCHKCPSAFEKREQYRVHLTLHGAKQRYRCDTCDYSVKYYANYIQHLKKHQANAEAQASRRQFEDDTITIDGDTVSDNTGANSRSSKTLKSPTSSASILSSSSASMLNLGGAQASNQDKQSLMLLQKKGILLSSNDEVETLHCQSCPFSTCDKDAMDAHKRRHGIERMTPSCPHCDYIPRKDENVGEHIRLHFTRLYKPESYLIIELLTLTMKKVTTNGKEEKQKSTELLFKEYADGRFFPFTDINSFGGSSAVSSCKEKVIVDPNTGETKHLTM
ncbi:zinc finger protein 91-like isoform X1 [Frieseomelitta varia]|uniref:zinc finger protein 91-like isoform X1 n=1 Tax=Frieseomelitta varia TaxID=561572 RepID=UPI001CB6A513|nr:zinc finger protein 91-like isoform X1 [Frieseomelitta varia]XP_043506786.1 zinc finger protein 91-like isoform X1 [Frieseomelitta varia]XP_043506787.1 zinc finger protein 91-like isoform X1 [Frieseomelitta varia]XP_043506788.1 zinc finger protein 91-like isoform X1 [Frieseomelitta varia]XP_043506789.1 zinc finger protein 91-like isoform X1 [Frieseomelitta varia]